MPSSDFEVITAKSSHRPPWLLRPSWHSCWLEGGGWATRAEDTPAVESPVFLLPSGDGVRVVGADLLTGIDPGNTWYTTMFVDGYSVQAFPSSTTNPVIDTGSEPASVKGQPAFWITEERGVAWTAMKFSRGNRSPVSSPSSSTPPATSTAKPCSPGVSHHAAG